MDHASIKVAGIHKEPPRDFLSVPTILCPTSNSASPSMPFLKRSGRGRRLRYFTGAGPAGRCDPCPPISSGTYRCYPRDHGVKINAVERNGLEGFESGGRS